MNTNTQLDITLESTTDIDHETVDVELSLGDLDLIGGGAMVDVFL